MSPKPDKRSDDRVQDLEQRFEMHQTSVSSQLDRTSQDIAELKQTSTKVAEYLKSLDLRLASLAVVQNPQPSTVVGASPGAESGSSSAVRVPSILGMPAFGTFPVVDVPSPTAYSVPTKNSRVEFPRFDGDDFRGWAYRCRQFFEVDGTPPEHRIRLLSIHLEGHALRWHQTFMRNRNFSDVRWDDYFQHMEAKFADVRT